MQYEDSKAPDFPRFFPETSVGLKLSLSVTALLSYIPFADCVALSLFDGRRAHDIASYFQALSSLPILTLVIVGQRQPLIIWVADDL